MTSSSTGCPTATVKNATNAAISSTRFADVIIVVSVARSSAVDAVTRRSLEKLWDILVSWSWIISFELLILHVLWKISFNWPSWKKVLRIVRAELPRVQENESLKCGWWWWWNLLLMTMISRKVHYRTSKIEGNRVSLTRGFPGNMDEILDK